MIYLMVQVFLVLLAAALVLELSAVAAALWQRLRGRLASAASPAEISTARQPESV